MLSFFASLIAGAILTSNILAYAPRTPAPFTTPERIVFHDNYGACAESLYCIADSGARPIEDGLNIANFAVLDNYNNLNYTCFGVSETLKRWYSNDSLYHDVYDVTEFYSEYSRDLPVPIPSELLDITNGDICGCRRSLEVYDNISTNITKYFRLGYFDYSISDDSSISLKLRSERIVDYNYYYDITVLTENDIHWADYHFNLDGQEYLLTSVEVPVISVPKLIDTFTNDKLSDNTRKRAALMYYMYAMWRSQTPTSLLAQSEAPIHLWSVYNTGDTPFFASWTNIEDDFHDNYFNVFFSKLYSDLREGTPSNLVLWFQSDYEDSKHSVLCTRILRSFDNPYLCYLEIYDSNHPDEYNYIRYYTDTDSFTIDNIKYSSLFHLAIQDMTVGYDITCMPAPASSDWVAVS